jgi:tRNA pseudouridine38-40 synthase
VTLFDPEANDRPSGREAQASGAGVQRVRLTVAYDGTDFHGFAAQERQRTVAGVLGEALQVALRHEVDLTCAGRTDRGVHAWGQVVSFDAPHDADLCRLRRSVNSMLGPEVVVRDAAMAEAGFSARFDARTRTYKYTIVNRDAPDPFRARFAWWIDAPLDVRALRIASDAFIGEHDFASFCRKPKVSGSSEVPSLRRRVTESRWDEVGDGVLQYEVSANAFCWQMVRSVVGTLVEVGTGKRRPGEMLGIIRAADRAAAGDMAPPHGLCLWHVDY